MKAEAARKLTEAYNSIDFFSSKLFNEMMDNIYEVIATKASKGEHTTYLDCHELAKWVENFPQMPTKEFEKYRKAIKEQLDADGYKVHKGMNDSSNDLYIIW